MKRILMQGRRGHFVQRFDYVIEGKRGEQHECLLGDSSTLDYVLNDHGVPVQFRTRFLGGGVSFRPKSIQYRHPHPSFDRIFLFKQNPAILANDDGEHSLEPNVIYLVPVGQSFQVAYPDDCILYFYHIDFRDQSGLQVFDGTQGFPALTDAPELASLLFRVMADGDPASVHATLMAVLTRFAQSRMDELKARAGKTQEHARIIEYIDDHLSARLSVAELAATSHMSRTVLSRRFHEAVGRPLKTYLLERLMARAKEQLVFSDRSIETISDELGYKDPCYFHRIFRKYTGTTPREFRLRFHY